MNAFFQSFVHYMIDLFPALVLGLIVSGIVNEFISDKWIKRHLGGTGLKGVFFSTLIGAIVPVCCWGSLPIAVSLRKKGASLGPIFAILIATPATSVNAVAIMWKFMGWGYAAFVFVGVIFVAVIAGIIGNMIPLSSEREKFEESTNCLSHNSCGCSHFKHVGIKGHVFSILKYAFVDMPKEIGLEIMIGIALAAFVSSFSFVETVIQNYLTTGYDYVFSILSGLIMYMCATMSIPFVHALVEQGLNAGAGMTLLVLGPIASYGTILVLKKEFGYRVLLSFLTLICLSSLLLGMAYAQWFNF